MEAIASGLTITSAGIGVAKVVRDVCDEHKNLARQIQHSNRQCQQLRHTLAHLEKLPQSTKDKFGPMYEALNDVESSLSSDLPFGRKRDKLKWAWSKKDNAHREAERLKAAESSAVLNILVQQVEEIERINLSLGELRFDFANRLSDNSYTHGLWPENYLRKRVVSTSYQADWLLKHLGLVMRGIRHGDFWQIYMRWPLRIPFAFGQVVTIEKVTQSWFLPSLRVGLTPQNLIPEDSEILQACTISDVAAVLRLLEARAAHPNDCTPSNLTVFRYAIRSGNPQIVQVLLEHGADPNLTFGEFETSPLNNALLVGNIAIIRMLINAGADLEYKNSRCWTSISFLWDPSHPRYDTTSEVLEICMERHFSAWNDVDTKGWGVVHRAAAYGCGEDMFNLAMKGANLHTYTTDFLWGPITCAVRQGNQSTFEALETLLSRQEIVQYRDARGWSLLHFAMQNGHEAIARMLVGLGVDSEALTMGTNYWVTDSFAGRRLTAEMIAREYGHEEVWHNLMGDT